MKQIVSMAEEGTRLRVVGDTVRVLADSGDTAGGYEIFEMEGPAGSGPPPHAHPWAESYVMTEGEAEILVEGTTFIARPGCFFQIPAGITHAYRIVSESARFVIVTSPSGASEFFTELDAETAGSCEDMGKVVAVALKHGFTLPA